MMTAQERTGHPARRLVREMRHKLRPRSQVTSRQSSLKRRTISADIGYNISLGNRNFVNKLSMLVHIIHTLQRFLT